MKPDNEENTKLNSLLERLKQVSGREVDVEEIRRRIEEVKQQARIKAKQEIRLRLSQKETQNYADVRSLIGSASLGAIAATSISLLIAPAMIGAPVLLSGIGALVGLASNIVRSSTRRKKELNLIKAKIEEELVRVIEEEIKKVIQEELEQAANSGVSKTESETTED